MIRNTDFTILVSLHTILQRGHVLKILDWRAKGFGGTTGSEFSKHRSRPLFHVKVVVVNLSYPSLVRTFFIRHTLVGNDFWKWRCVLWIYCYLTFTYSALQCTIIKDQKQWKIKQGMLCVVSTSGLYTVLCIFTNRLVLNVTTYLKSWNTTTQNLLSIKFSYPAF